MASWHKLGILVMLVDRTVLHWHERIDLVKGWFRKEGSNVNKLEELFKMVPEFEKLFSDAKNVTTEDPAVQGVINDLLAIETSLKGVES